MSTTGPASGLLPGTRRAVDQQVAAAQATGRVPALVAAVVRGGALAHVAAAGDGVPDPVEQVQFRIGSITKTMTAAMVLQLRDAGLLNLDDLLYRHLPGTPVGGVTLRQLLGHISGLQREPPGPWWERAEGRSLEELLEKVSPDALTHPPQRRHHYSNLAYGLLGAVLYRVTGESWQQLLERRLRTPLGLRRTTYLPEEPFARGYVVHPWHGTLREEPRYDSRAMAPAGQLWSTLEDLGRWAAFLADPDPKVLAAGTLAEMCNPVAISDPQAWTAGHGLGLGLRRAGERVYAGHTGSMPGYLAVLVVHRASGTAVVAFANAYTLHGDSMAGLGTRLLSLVLDAEPPPRLPWRPAPGPPPEEVAPLLGRWWWMGREFQASWDTQAEELVLAAVSDGPGMPARFAREGADRWRGTAGADHGEQLTIRRDSQQAVVELDIATFVYTRDP